MITRLTLKCPSCGGEISIEPNREFCFCQYCGTKILISDENKKTFDINVNQNINHTINQNINQDVTYRYINEAETEKIRLEREMNALNYQEAQSRKKANKKGMIYLAIGVLILFIGAGTFNLMLIGVAFVFLVLSGGSLLQGTPSEKDNSVVPNKSIKLTRRLVNVTGLNYKDVEREYSALGFYNIKTIPMEDLTLDIRRINEKVDHICINGKTNFRPGDEFDDSAKIDIYYHSF